MVRCPIIIIIIIIITQRLHTLPFPFVILALLWFAVCKPDLKIDFERGFRDVSGNGYRIMARHVRLFKGAAYFRGDSKLIVEPFRPKVDDDGTYIVKLRYREDLRRRGRGGFRGAGRGRGRMRRTRGLQALVTNGHCGKEASVVVAKIPGKVFVGAETNMSKSFYLPTVVRKWFYWNRF